MVSVGKINLEKHESEVKNVISLLKLDNTQAKVAMVLDISGSMYGLYKSGTVQNVLLRLFAVAKQFDDDQKLDSFAFSQSFARLPEITMDNFENYIQVELLDKFNSEDSGPKEHKKLKLSSKIQELEESLKPKKGFLGFGKKEVSSEQSVWIQEEIQTLKEELSKLNQTTFQIFEGNNEPDVMNDIMKKYTVEEPSELPTYVIFISDGGVSRNQEIERIIRESASKPVFWQFVGLGRSNYGALEKLDDMTGRVVDNANFFALDDINSISDKELYTRLLGEFPNWIQEAKNKNIL